MKLIVSKLLSMTTKQRAQAQQKRSRVEKTSRLDVFQHQPIPFEGVEHRTKNMQLTRENSTKYIFNFIDQL